MVWPNIAFGSCQKPCHISDDGRNLIQVFEGFSPFIYNDISGHPTIGYGHLIKPGETFNQPLIGNSAEDLFISDIKPTEDGINHLVVVDIRQTQFDAIGSFTFNLGIGTLKRSTLLKYVNQKRDNDVLSQFPLWVYAGGKKSAALAVRRSKEAKIYARM